MFTTRPSPSFLSFVGLWRRLPGEIKRASSALVKETREHHDADEVQPQQPLRDPSTPTGSPVSSRIYVLGRRKEQEVDVGEALRALRAYSLTAVPETVEVNIKVDMTLKKVRII